MRIFPPFLLTRDTTLLTVETSANAIIWTYSFQTKGVSVSFYDVSEPLRAMANLWQLSLTIYLSSSSFQKTMMNARWNTWSHTGMVLASFYSNCERNTYTKNTWERQITAERMKAPQRRSRTPQRRSRTPPPGKPDVSIITFLGMGVDTCHENNLSFIDLLSRNLQHAGYTVPRDIQKCFAPPLKTTAELNAKGLSFHDTTRSEQRLWAEYMPEAPDRRLNDNMNEREAKLQHYDHSCRVAGNMKSWYHLTMQEPDLALAQIKNEYPNVLFLFVGSSNGAIPAWEFAKHYSEEGRTIGCILNDGCPNFDRKENRQVYDFPIIFSVAGTDWRFDGGRRLYRAARELRASLVYVPDEKHAWLQAPGRYIISKTFMALLAAKQITA